MSDPSMRQALADPLVQSLLKEFDAVPVRLDGQPIRS